jgi:hypothetical protein
MSRYKLNWLAVVVTAALLLTPLALHAAPPTFYFSVDIGSDWEMSDTNSPGPLDPGDIYDAAGIALEPRATKDDFHIFESDPPPAPGVPVGLSWEPGIEVLFFDLDGEDQLEIPLVQVDGPMLATPGGGLYLNPDQLYYSLDDDQAPGWYAGIADPDGDVPVDSPPDNGAATNEILSGQGWSLWAPAGRGATETELGLGPDPGPTTADDDVDALDIEIHQYWYWSCDHEATLGLDPGDIYVTDQGAGPGGGPVLSIDNTVIGVVDGTDIDAFEFLATDDPGVLQHFGVPPDATPYLALIFSVDEDDPDTPAAESGGLDPAGVYISLFAGFQVPPLELSRRGADVDALALGLVPVVEVDFGDAPESPTGGPQYPTLLVSTGASHIIGGPWLGPPDDAPDAESDGLPHSAALGDDLTNTNDEDGVWFPTLVRDATNGIKVIVTSASGSAGVDGWIDFNADGDWDDAGELVYSGSMVAGTNFITVVPGAGAAIGSTFARFRVSTIGMLSPRGPAEDGEVEDHNLFITDSGYVDWCNLQWPSNTMTKVSVPTENIYGRVWVPGVTDADAFAPGIGLKAQLGYGPDASSPDGNPAWKWVDAAYNMDKGNNDEFCATLTVPAAGKYDYAYRYTRNNGVAWSYGDLDGSSNGYDPAMAGDLTVYAECPKWIQEPDCKAGLDLESWGGRIQGDDVFTASLVADDWLCDGRPITAIRWWGSYIGYDGPPEPPLTETRPTGFVLRWYTDLPAAESPTGYSMPGGLITNVYVELLPYDVEEAPPGYVEERYLCTTDLGGLQPPLPIAPFEHEYEYYVKLPSEWLEKEDRIYWLAIEAKYDMAAEPTNHIWGWKTTDPHWNWNDDAVVSMDGSVTGTNWIEMVYPPPMPPWFVVENHPHNGQSVNMAFEMLTDVCPSRCTKWSQMPDMELGMNMDSWEYEGADEGDPFTLRADDFLSDGRPITDVHWWGSYIDYEMHTYGTETNPVPPPSAPFSRPLGFNLSWHAADPTGVCLPGPTLTNVFVSITNCHEMFYGTVVQWWTEPPTFEHEYQYYVDFLDPEVGMAPWLEQAGEIYWINIQAVFSRGFDPGPQAGHYGWGWKISDSLPDWQFCPSAVSTNNGSGWINPILPFYPGYPWSDMLFDLAFELTTTNIPPTNGFAQVVDVRFTNIAVNVGMDSAHMWTTGYCGCGVQVLQASTNILVPGGGWESIYTNTLPRPENLWTNLPAGPYKYYRIMQKD